MKGYEARTRPLLPARNFHVLRVDGKNFSSYTKGLGRPFDQAFMDHMDAMTRELCAAVDGALLGFTQSDEASVVFTDLGGSRTQPHLGGSLNKITSLSAALATAAFNELRPGKRALFDARVLTLPREEVMNYFLDRQRDATKNAVTMAASVEFSHKQLDGRNSNERLEMLLSRGVDFDTFPSGFKQGRVSLKTSSAEPVTFTDGRTKELVTREVTRSRWTTSPALDFAAGLPVLLPEAEAASEVDLLG
jgi:tRNA(His) 5'-end guanylyltransferase